MKKVAKQFHFLTILSSDRGFTYYNKSAAKKKMITSKSINHEGTGPVKPTILAVTAQGVAKKWLQPTHYLARYEIENI